MNNTTHSVKAKEIETDELAGTKLFNNVLLFSKNKNNISNEFTLDISENNDCNFYIAGVSAGKWNIIADGSIVATATVTDGENIMTFTAPGDHLTISPDTTENDAKTSNCKNSLLINPLVITSAAGACSALITRKKKSNK